MADHQVKLSNGETVTVRMPIMGDIMEDIFFKNVPWMHVVVKASTGKSWDWFLHLSLLDGLAVVKELAPVMHHTLAIMQSINNLETKH